MDSIVLTYKSCSLKQSDINCLGDYSQLNDIIISFYYEILSEKFHRDDVVLLDPAVSMSITIEPNLDDINQCIFTPLQMGSKKFIFAPINDNKKIDYQTGGSHWALGLVDVGSQTIYYLDSMLSDIDNAHLMHKRLEKLFKKKFAFRYPICQKYQSNSFDCGMFVLAFTETLLGYLKEKGWDKSSFSELNFDDLFSRTTLVSESNMSAYRKEIKAIINNIIQEKQKK